MCEREREYLEWLLAHRDHDTVQSIPIHIASRRTWDVICACVRVWEGRWVWVWV